MPDRRCKRLTWTDFPCPFVHFSHELKTVTSIFEVFRLIIKTPVNNSLVVLEGLEDILKICFKLWPSFLIVEDILVRTLTPMSATVNKWLRFRLLTEFLRTASNFDYFAGGGFLSPTGNNKDLPSLYDVAKQQGYTVATTQSEIAAVNKSTGKIIAIDENLADGDAMAYDLDRKDGQFQLADYVQKGIEVLDNDNGFFMMIEGGKVDWACHANDAGASIGDTIALDKAVQTAYKFYEKHPSETLILVTGDHETGGMTIGFAGTNYDTYLKNMENQKISYAKFDSDYVANYKKSNTPFSQVLVDIKNNFGLVTASDAASAADPKLVLTDYELNRLKTAYQRTLKVGTSSQDKMSQEEYVLYGTYEPLTVTITHILNNKSGIAFTSYSHTGLPVPVFAVGNGSALFEGYYDNTDIFDKLAALTRVK